MSPNMKLTLLALVGAAAAVPHNGAHSKFHQKARGYAGPQGGWSSENSTLPAPTGAAVDDKTTTLLETLYSTETLFKTIYATKSKSGAAAEAPSSVAAVAADVSTAAAVCGPATVYVTATTRLTVTLPSAGASSSAYTPPAYTPVVPGVSSAAPEVPSSAAPEVPSSTPVYVAPSSAAKEEASSSPAPVYTPAPSSEVIASSAAPISSAAPSSVVVVPSSAAPIPSAAPSSVVVVPSSAESSATPSATPSSSPSYTGGKRGLAYRWDGASDCKTFDNKNFGFAWNWEADTKGDIGNIPFIPTLRTADNNGPWADKVEAAISAGSKVVFGYNEPDMPSQANMGIDALCSNWKTNMNPIAAKHPSVEIVGPSVSSSENAGQGLDYLSQFKSRCPDATWGAANIHWYGPPSAGFDAFKAHVDKAVGMFGKVWVTEFALSQASPDQTKDFLEKAVAYLDGNAACEGYSFYAVGNFDPAFTMLGTANSLTVAGDVYVS